MLDHTLSVAPMMGCTDRHCRYLLRLISPHALIYSEMIVTGALIHGHRDHFLSHQLDEPVALQLGGSNPAELALCARMAEDYGYQEVNLNVGCPSDKVKHGGIGACLMAEPELVAECVSAMNAVVNIPVTVKSRTGIDDQDSYEFFHQFVSLIAAAGCEVFVVHARKAMLNGLSPKENREIPPLHYERVFQIKQDFPDRTVIINGGLPVAEAGELLTQVDGVMYGREAYHNPWCLTELEQALFGTPIPERQAVMNGYLSYMSEQISAGTAIKHMARHLLGFYLGCKGARGFRRHLSETMYRPGACLQDVKDAISMVEQSHHQGQETVVC